MATEGNKDIAKVAKVAKVEVILPLRSMDYQSRHPYLLQGRSDIYCTKVVSVLRGFKGAVNSQEKFNKA